MLGIVELILRKLDLALYFSHFFFHRNIVGNLLLQFVHFVLLAGYSKNRRIVIFRIRGDKFAVCCFFCIRCLSLYDQGLHLVQNILFHQRRSIILRLFSQAVKVRAVDDPVAGILLLLLFKRFLCFSKLAVQRRVLIPSQLAKCFVIPFDLRFLFRDRRLRQKLDLAFLCAHSRLCFIIGALKLLQRLRQLLLGLLGFLQVGSGQIDLLRRHRSRRQLLLRVGQRLPELLDIPVFPGIIGAAHVDQGALIIPPCGRQLLLRLGQLGAVLIGQQKQLVAHGHRIAHLHIDGLHRAGLAQNDLIGVAGGNGAAAPDAGVDGIRGNGGRAHLRQRPVEDRLGKEGQHQQDAEENDGRVFYPAAFFDFVFFHDHLPFHRAGLGDALHQVFFAV